MVGGGLEDELGGSFADELNVSGGKGRKGLVWELFDDGNVGVKISRGKELGGVAGAGGGSRRGSETEAGK